MKTTLFFIISTFYFLSLNAQWSQFALPCSSLTVSPWLEAIYVDNLEAKFVSKIGANKTIKWNGTSWIIQGQGDLTNPLLVGSQHLCGDLLGNIYTSESAFINGIFTSYVTKFDGTNWSKLGNFDFIGGGINSLYVDALNNIYAGCYTTTKGNYVAKWDGNNWSELGGNNSLQANNTIISICSDSQGNILAGGAFTNNKGSVYIAKWDGSNWSELGGSNSLKANNTIYTIEADNSGNVYVGGTFTNPNGYMYIAKFNGQVWSETALLGSPSAKLLINTIRCDKKGNVYVSCSNTFQQGFFNVFKLVNNSLIAMSGNNPCQEIITASSSVIEYHNVSSIDLDTAGNIYAVGGIGNANCNPVVMKYTAPWLVGLSKYDFEKMKITLYPNPAMEEINFTVSGGTNQKYNLSLSNSLGQILIDITNRDLSEALDISSLTPGIYFIQIQNKDYKQTFKVVKE